MDITMQLVHVPKQVKQVRPSMFNSTKAWVVTNINEFKAKRMKADFEHKLAQVIIIANGHKAKGTPLGNVIYGNLYDAACSLVEQYSKLANVSAEHIITRSPALNELKGWAEYDAEKVHIHRFKVILGSVFGGAIGIGLLAGIIKISYFAVTFWINYHPG